MMKQVSEGRWLAIVFWIVCRIAFAMWEFFMFFIVNSWELHFVLYSSLLGVLSVLSGTMIYSFWNNSEILKKILCAIMLIDVLVLGIVAWDLLELIYYCLIAVFIILQQGYLIVKTFPRNNAATATTIP